MTQQIGSGPGYSTKVTNWEKLKERSYIAMQKINLKLTLNLSLDYIYAVVFGNLIGGEFQRKIMVEQFIEAGGFVKEVAEYFLNVHKGTIKDVDVTDYLKDYCKFREIARYCPEKRKVPFQCGKPKPIQRKKVEQLATEYLNSINFSQKFVLQHRAAIVKKWLDTEFVI